jgi:alpha/beta superfamily hydrolase
MLHLPEGDGLFPGAVLCHPHPEFGGSMDASIIGTLARGLAHAGWAALRFNFRGVGESQGAYDEGRGEAEDVEAAIAFLGAQAAVDASRLAVVGYSFGAWAGLEAAQRSLAVKAVVAIGLPMWRFGEGWLSAYGAPKLFLAGERDTLCPLEDLKRWAQELPGPVEIVVLSGADHYLAGRELQVATEVTRFLQSHV